MSATFLAHSTSSSPTLAPIAEPLAIVDTVVSGFLAVDAMEDDLYRLCGYVTQRNLHDGTQERVVAVRMVMTLPALMRLNMALSQAVGVRS